MNSSEHKFSMKYFSKKEAQHLGMTFLSLDIIIFIKYIITIKINLAQK